MHKFDKLTIEKLRAKAAIKWKKYPEDVLPLWVADMDFPIADEIKEAIVSYMDTDMFGYAEYEGLPGLKDAVIERMWNRYNWDLKAEDIYPISGIVQGLFLSVLATSSEAEEVIVQTPVYGPFMMSVEKANRKTVYNQLYRDDSGWGIDFDLLESQISPATRMLMLCNPHNPVGRAYSRNELERLAEIVLKHRLWVVSDELHSDLIYLGFNHIPFASLSPEIAQRTITLFGASKTFNIAGLKTGFLATENSALMQHVQNIAAGIVAKPNVLGQIATIAAYQKADDWLGTTLNYLDKNRIFVANYLAEHLPDIKHSAPEASYLAWMDTSKYNLENPSEFLLENAKVALNDGAWFGPGGEGHVRLNFASSQYIIEKALERIKIALADVDIIS